MIYDHLYVVRTAEGTSALVSALNPGDSIVQKICLSDFAETGRMLVYVERSNPEVSAARRRRRRQDPSLLYQTRTTLAET